MISIDLLSLADFGEPPWTAPLLVAATSCPSSCDVVVVGAGVTGLSAAIALSARGTSVTVVDRAVGGGATARSGGIVLGETLIGPAAAFDGCERTLRRWIEESGIQCDAVWNGCLELTREPQSSGSDTGWVDDGPLRVGSRMSGGTVDPRKLLRGLLDEAVRAGATVFSGVKVEHIESRSGGPLVIAGGTSISARAVVMAVDATAWAHQFDPWEQRTLTVALQTESAPDVADAIGLDLPFYTRELPLLWGRRLPDGSLLLGRELVEWAPSADRNLTRARIAAAGDRLTSRVRRLHHRLSDVTIQRIWAGPTARTKAGIPTVVDDPSIGGMIWAGGYGGHGIAQAFTLGRLAARHVVSELSARSTNA